MTVLGIDRHRPEGDWVQTTTVEKVVGIKYRKDGIMQFLEAVKRAEAKKLWYSVEARLELDNRHDPYAIAIDGVACVKGWFGKKIKRWHVGYLPKELSRELYEDLIMNDVPISAELYKIFISAENFVDIGVIILAPRGYGHKARLKRK